MTECNSKEPFFTLVLKMRNHPLFQDMALEMVLMLYDIGIGLDVIFLDWEEYAQELFTVKDYDIYFLSTYLYPIDPDMTRFFTENGDLNFCNYDSSLDYNSSLGLGQNQWYLEEGKRITPPNSEERIQHYWKWQDYVMTEINPALFTLTPKRYVAHWATLEGYNINEDILQSWGKMSWKTPHPNQTSQMELITTDATWENLNPLLQDDSNEEFISSAIVDPLVWIDSDHRIYPHIATSWTHINDTHVRIHLREGIKWQADLEGNFTNEYLTAEDVYFTFYCWANLSVDQDSYSWVKEMKIVDEYTIDFYIDADPGTTENELYPPYLYYLAKGILPEHYLNQTQLADGKTPLTDHYSWSLYNNNKSFGSGMFEYDSFKVVDGSPAYNETTLIINPECWLFNNLIDKSDMNFEERFGTKWSLDTLKIKHYHNHLESAFEFLWGNIDIMEVTSYPENRTLYQSEESFTVQSKNFGLFSYFGYNLAPSRPYIGSRIPCPNDPSMTIGLAIRKAISHAINREEINTRIFGGEYAINNYPLDPTMGVWLNPNIYHYDYDVAKAKEYLAKVGFISSTTNDSSQKLSIIFSEIIILSTIIIVIRRKKS